MELISKIRETVVAEINPLEFTTLVCLCIQQLTHAKAAHSNFEISSKQAILKLPQWR